MGKNKVIEYISFDDFVRQRRENQELPEVEVKSDLSKWLLLGGCVVFGYYLWRNIK